MRSAGFWLYHAAREWQAEVERALRPCELTFTQFNLLASTGWLGRSGHTPTQQEVVELAGIDRMMGSRVIRGLAERGLIDRQADPTDARALRLALTPAGHALGQRATPLVTDTDARIFGESATGVVELLRPIAEQRH
jgi:DNA-binding MarR family transcriptional regulator